VLVGGSVGTRRRQHRYSWEAVGGRQRIGIGHFGPKQSVQQLLEYFVQHI